MKFFVGLLVASLAVGGVFSLPAGSPNDDAEVIDIPRRQVINRHNADDSDDSSAGEPDFKDFKGVIDTGVGYPFLQPHPLPFSFNLGFFDAFEDIFKRLHDQLWTSSLPSEGDTFSSFDPSKGNTTSTVKIVDGHKVEVNETVYGDENSVFKVRLVNIRPVDSGEDVDETTVKDPNASNPVTSAPNKNSYDTESDERREPLEKKSDENEIKRNIDEPEHTEPQALAQLILNKMLPVANENNTANLNAAFVTDNSLEVAEGNGNIEQSSEEEIAKVVEIDGNIEAETNKSVNNSIVKEEMENNESTTIIPTIEDKKPAVEQDDVQRDENQALTIENNEEMERTNSPNESSYYDVEADASTATDDNNMTAPTTEPETDLRTELNVDNTEDSATELVEIDNVAEPVKSADYSAEWVGDDAVNAAGEGVDEIDDDPNEKRYASYASNKNREDVSSSDDEEGGEAVEMNPEFNSEWADLKEDLAKNDDQKKALSNDIDAYDTVPVDLSNDISVNDLAAANPNFPTNPDAEIIFVSGIKSPDVMRPFEKLSISATIDPTGYEVDSVLASDK